MECKVSLIGRLSQGACSHGISYGCLNDLNEFERANVTRPFMPYPDLSEHGPFMYVRSGCRGTFNCSGSAVTCGHHMQAPLPIHLCVCDPRCHEYPDRSERELAASTPRTPVVNPTPCTLCLDPNATRNESKREQLLIAVYETRRMRLGTYYGLGPALNEHCASLIPPWIATPPLCTDSRFCAS